MKVLFCHNYYQQRGGEDMSFEAEVRLLRSFGHEVVEYTRHNDDVKGMGRLAAARKTIWNHDTYRDLKALIAKERPDVVHCNNLFPLISPSAYYAAKRAGVPVVQALRNYRMFCAGAVFLRDGKLCTDCHTRGCSLPGVLRGCYRESRTASAVVTAMQAVHRFGRTWKRMVDAFFTPSELTRAMYIQGGLDGNRILVKPNFIDPDPGLGQGGGGYALFVGRLSPEKGIATLLEAWQRLPANVPLKIIGDGPLRGDVADRARHDARVEWLGRKPAGEVLDLMGQADVLVVPSVTYETFGRTIVEGFAKGAPVVASRLGAFPELIDDCRTGLLFSPGNADELAGRVARLFDQPSLARAIRAAAREQYLQKYRAAENHEKLMTIYEQAIRTAASAANRRKKITRPTGEPEALTSRFVGVGGLTSPARCSLSKTEN